MKSVPGEFRCPMCGTALSPNARSCSHCRASRDGAAWLAPEVYDGLDFGDEEFDYDEFVRREFGTPGGRANWFTRLTTKERFWWVVAVLMFVVFTVGAVFLF